MRPRLGASGLTSHLGPREAGIAAINAASETIGAPWQGHPSSSLRHWRCWRRSACGPRMCKIDNAALVASLRSGRCTQRATMALVRAIALLAKELHLTIVPDWVPTAKNDVADALSRSD